MAVKFKDTININGEYTFPNTDGSVGQAIITDGGGNLTFGSAVASSADNSESVHIPVKNTSGVSISKGTPVYITGETGNSGKIEIAAADAVNANKMPVLGLLESTLSDNGEGFCVQGGLLENVATATIDGQTPTANQTVYVKSGGGLTLTKPTGTALIQNIAKVARVHASQGSLVVSAILRTNDIPNLPEGKIWVGDDNTTVSTIVHLDELNGRVGIGTDSPTSILHLADTIPRIKIQDTTDNSVSEILYNAGGLFIRADQTDIAASSRVVFEVDATERMRIDSAGDIAFRDTSANEAFYWDASTARLGIGTGSSPSANLEIENGQEGLYLVVGGDNAGNARGLRFTSSTSSSNSIGALHTIKANSIGGEIAFANGNGNIMHLDVDGNVGIGISSPSSILHLLGAVGNNKQLRLATSQTTYWDIGRSNLTGHFEITEDSGDTYFLINKDNGNVGINTITPSVSLDISGTDAIQVPKGLTSDRPTPASGMFRFNTTTNEFEGYNGTEWAPIGGANAASIDVDSFTGDAVETAFTLSSAISEEVATQIYIDGVYQSKDNYSTSGTTLTFTDAPADGASIEVVHFTGISESDLNGSGTTNYISKWLDTDTLTNSIIYDNGTNVGIGTSSPSKKLHINSGNTNDVALFESTDSFANIYIKDNSGEMSIQKVGTDVLISAETSTTHGNLRFLSNSGTERMRIASNGNVGIGISSPQAKFHAKSSGNGSYIIRGMSSAATDLGGLFQSTAGDGEIYLKTSAVATNVRISSNNVTYFNGGNVGIGTDSPETGLHLKGTTNTSSCFTIENTSGGSSKKFGFQPVYNDDRLDIWYNSNATPAISIKDGGNVGIGTSSPGHKLHVAGATYIEHQGTNWNEITPGGNRGSLHIDPVGDGAANTGGAITFGASDAGAGASAMAGIYTRSDGSYGTKMYFATTNSYAAGSKTSMFIGADGKIGIGTVSPSAKLDVVGTIECTSLTETSALRFKENIQEDVDTSIIDKLRPVSYDWKETGDKDYGFIAEEVDELDSILTTKEEDGQLIGIKYTKLIPFLVKKIQEQEERIKQLENGKS